MVFDRLGRAFWLSIPFWIAVAVVMVVLFNYEDSLPKLMGYSTPTIVEDAFVLACCIGPFIYQSVRKRNPHA